MTALLLAVGPNKYICLSDSYPFKSVNIIAKSASWLHHVLFISLRPSDFLSFRQHVSACCPLYKFPRNLILVTLVKNSLESLHLVNIEQKYKGLYIKTYVRFILLAAICSATKTTEGIVVLLDKAYNIIIQGAYKLSE
jgi:hypothetical protein